MSNMKLVTTETFGEIPCDFYRNMNDDILLTREQIGTALEYASPSKAIQKIHLKHKDRLEPFCLRTTEIRYPQTGGAGIKVETIYYTERGIMEICRWSSKPLANKFMDWCWDIVEKYRHNQGFVNEIDMKSINTLAQSITTLNAVITIMHQNISDLKEYQSQSQKQIQKKSFTRWTSRMFPKYQLLMDYFGVDRKELYHNLFLELQNLYPDIDLAQMQDDYCFKNNLDSCFTMEVVEHNKELRILFENMVDNLLERYMLVQDH